MSPQLKLLPPSKPRLGLYLRPGRNDHTVFQQLLAEDKAVSGLVLDARHLDRQRELRASFIDNGVHAVLDVDFMEMATPGGSILAGLADLPWARFAAASADELHGRTGRQLAAAIADAVADGGFSAVLAPTHLLSSGRDAFFGADCAVAGFLRHELDRRGLTDRSVFYPLALPTVVLRDRAQLTLLIEGLRATPVDAVWLRLSPFGTSTSGPIALRHYIESAWQLQRIGRPLVGERTGTVGVALLAFGAVGGIESGITLGERFDAQSLTRPRDPRATPFSPPPRVYLHEIGAFLSRQSAETLFQSRQMIAALGCRDARCCRGGTGGMLKNPRRHFVLRRTAEVDRIGGVAPDARATVYLHDILAPAALLSVRAARVAPELLTVQRRLEAWHLTLDAIVRAGPCPVPLAALGQRSGVTNPKPQAMN